MPIAWPYQTSGLGAYDMGVPKYSSRSRARRRFFPDEFRVENISGGFAVTFREREHPRAKPATLITSGDRATAERARVTLVRDLCS